MALLFLLQLVLLLAVVARLCESSRPPQREVAGSVLGQALKHANGTMRHRRKERSNFVDSDQANHSEQHRWKSDFTFADSHEASQLEVTGAAEHTSRDAASISLGASQLEVTRAAERTSRDAASISRVANNSLLGLSDDRCSSNFINGQVDCDTWNCLWVPPATEGEWFCAFTCSSITDEIDCKKGYPRRHEELDYTSNCEWRDGRCFPMDCDEQVSKEWGDSLKFCECYTTEKECGANSVGWWDKSKENCGGCKWVDNSRCQVDNAMTKKRKKC